MRGGLGRVTQEGIKITVLTQAIREAVVVALGVGVNEVEEAGDLVLYEALVAKEATSVVVLDHLGGGQTGEEEAGVWVADPAEARPAAEAVE